jgi:peptidoglycan hydrolase-like protein with peptidoglycan-binding domain
VVLTTITVALLGSMVNAAPARATAVGCGGDGWICTFQIVRPDSGPNDQIPANVYLSAWRNLFEICNGCQAGSSSRGATVALWQRILYAEYGSSIGQSCDRFVDGIFGPNTANWTRSWQTSRGIGVDGRVGPQTWLKASEGLRNDPSQILPDQWVTHWRYTGAKSGFDLTQAVPKATPYIGNWTFNVIC